MPKTPSPVRYVEAVSSEGECSASDDDGIGQQIKSSIVVASANKIASIQKANSAEPPSPTASGSDSSGSPKAKRRRSASHSGEEGETPEWKKERSFSPDDEIRERKWKPADEDGKSRRSHREREEARERRDQRRMEDRRRRFNDDRERVSDRRDESDDRHRSYYDRNDRHRDYRHRDRRYRDERDDRSDRYYDRDRSDRDRYRERRDDRRDEDRYRSRRDREDEEEKENKEKEKKKAAKTNKEDTLTTRTGGAYIPPARLRMMQEAITDKSSAEYQRMSWEALKKSINGLVNKVNVSNISDIIREILAENVIRGRGLLCQSIIRAQSASPTFTHVYAALVAIVNSKFPQIGELLLQRVILQFRRSFRRNDKAVCISSTQFIAHLVNQQVAHEIVALEILTLLLEKATDDSVEVAVGFLKECGMKLTEVSPSGINAIFERMRTVLHESEVDLRVQYMIEVMFQVRKDKFKDHKSIEEGLELVGEEDQFTHLLALDEVTSGQDILNVFQLDPEFQDNEEKYKEIKKELLGSDDDDSGSSDGGSGSDSSSSSSDDEEEEEAKQKIIDQTETNLVGLRRTIYLTLQSSLDYEEATHKLLKVQIKPGQESELCNMVLDCGAQQRTYEKFYGLIAQRLCMLDRKYVEHFEKMFMDQYQTCHRLDPTKLRNVSKFFAHLLHTDAVSWGVLQVVKMNEDDTTSSSRIFVKQLFVELCEYMGLPKLNDRLKDETLQGYFEGLMPKDHPKKTRFAINFFTSIGLGGVTDGLREHLKNMPKPTAGRPPSSSSSSDSSSSSSSSSSSDSSSSDSD